MATITPTPLSPPSGHDVPTGSKVYRWTMDSGDTALPVSVQPYTDRSAHFYASNWGSATLTIEGSNQADLAQASVTNFEVLRGADGSDLSKTADGMETILENTFWLKPVLTGAGATGVTVDLLVLTSARR